MAERYLRILRQPPRDFRLVLGETGGVGGRHLRLARQARGNLVRVLQRVVPALQRRLTETPYRVRIGPVEALQGEERIAIELDPVARGIERFQRNVLLASLPGQVPG